MANQNILLPSLLPDTFGNDNVPYNMGIVFYSTISGNLLGIRFFKAFGDDGLHIGRLYDAVTEQLLISVNFTNETSSGWQEAYFSNPYPITPFKRYLASVNLGNFIYSFRGAIFQTDYVNGNLVAPSSDNNRFSATNDGFPSGFFNSACYFRDIIFSTGGETKLQSALTAPAVISGKLKIPSRLTSNVYQQVKLLAILKSPRLLKSKEILNSSTNLRIRTSVRLQSKLISIANLKVLIRQSVDLQSKDLINVSIQGQVKVLCALKSYEKITVRISGDVKTGATSIERLKPIVVDTKLTLSLRSNVAIKSIVKINSTVLLNFKSGLGVSSLPAHITITMAPNATIEVIQVCD